MPSDIAAADGDLKSLGPGSSQASQTLYARLGGEATLAQIVSAVYQSLSEDEELAAFFSRFRLPALQARTLDYLRGEWGGAPYKGPDLFLTHTHLGITNRQYDIMAAYFDWMFKKFSVPRREAAEALESLERMRAAIVDVDLRYKRMYTQHAQRWAAQSRYRQAKLGFGGPARDTAARHEAFLQTAAAAAKSDGGAILKLLPKSLDPKACVNIEKSLYVRMGGEQVLRFIVSKVYQEMMREHSMSRFFDRFRVEALQERTVDYLRGEWGGPCYAGPDISIAHAHLSVTDEHYDIMLRLFATMFGKCKVPAAEAQECLASLERLREWTVARDILPTLYESEEPSAQPVERTWTEIKETTVTSVAHIAQLKRNELKARAAAMKRAPSNPLSWAAVRRQSSGSLSDCSTETPRRPRNCPRRANSKASVQSQAASRDFTFEPKVDIPPTSVPCTRTVTVRLSRAPEAMPCL
mmetsp:Transcript_85194/g.245930  ORF Transcript_85194/g.245930 Transcript_85194/m.245930 type:complete len:467 (+) Transcript_85194:78-1478(+)